MYNILNIFYKSPYVKTKINGNNTFLSQHFYRTLCSLYALNWLISLHVFNLLNVLNPHVLITQFPQLSILAPKPGYFETNMRQHIFHIHICINRRYITKILLQQEEKWQRSISKFPSQPVVGLVTLGRKHLWCPFPLPDTPRHPGPSPNSKVDVLLLLSAGQSPKPPQRYSLKLGCLLRGLNEPLPQVTYFFKGAPKAGKPSRPKAYPGDGGDLRRQKAPTLPPDAHAGPWGRMWGEKCLGARMDGSFCPSLFLAILSSLSEIQE